MASNEYYTQYNPPNAHPSATQYNGYSSRHDDTRPIPPTSPFDDQYAHHLPSPATPSASGRLHNDIDPFADNNAIPLRNKYNAHQTVSPHDNEDDFIRDADPQRHKRDNYKKDGWFSGKPTWCVYVLSFVQLVVFIAEIARMGVLTGSPIQIRPSVNPMLGPSPYVLISMGARYTPCMHAISSIQDSSVPISWPCPNATSTTGDSVSCQLSDLCGFDPSRNPVAGGSVNDEPAPDQWWRFIVPIFVHAGIVHIGFNLLLQLTLGRDVEKLIGSVRFVILYFAAGIFGFVLGGNFAANGIASTGCSGSLFGLLAINLLDLLYTWKDRLSPVKELVYIIIDVLIAFLLGLLPGLDNFSHIGGFFMGLVLGVCLLHSPKKIARRQSMIDPVVYSHIAPQGGRDESLKTFVKNPLGFFKDRQGVWWGWLVFRGFALLTVLIVFILLLKNFYVWKHTCSWCKYLSCLPITVSGDNWCSIGNLDFTPITTNTTSKRDVFELAKAVFELAALQWRHSRMEFEIWN